MAVLYLTVIGVPVLVQCLVWNSQEGFLDSGDVGRKSTHIRVVSGFVGTVALNRNNFKSQTMMFREEIPNDTRPVGSAAAIQLIAMQR